MTDGSDTLRGVRVRSQPIPAPSAGQVLVRVEAVALNYRDLLVARGQGPWRPPAGRIVASDACGRIVAVGPGVAEASIGDRVISTILPNWRSGPLTAEKLVGSLGGSAADGVLAEYVLFPAASVVPAPKDLTSVEAATLPCAALTAWQAVQRARSLQPGKTVLLQGTGGVSLFALQFAVAAGARVVITSSSDEKLERARAIGAEGLINYRTSGDWIGDARCLSPAGYDHVIDIGGGSTLPASIQLASYEGTVSVVGLIGGLVTELDLMPIFAKNLRIDGIEVGSREMLVELADWLGTTAIKPVVDRVFPLDDIAAALDHLAAGNHFGKVVIELS